MWFSNGVDVLIVAVFEIFCAFGLFNGFHDVLT